MDPIEEGEPITPVVPTPKSVSVGKKRKSAQEQTENEGGGPTCLFHAFEFRMFVRYTMSGLLLLNSTPIISLSVKNDRIVAFHLLHVD